MSVGDGTTTRRGFRVPLGVDPSGAIVTPKDAQKGTTYWRPACSSKLVLRKGKKKRFRLVALKLLVVVLRGESQGERGVA